ncbi:hypothetical protein ACFU96_21285 [Streptomyces sp. NPDC057620]|uniref:hypothetical protein n=1 Tax=Streptomyces sp. NPDC057620 TaxID=3346185 RepID=UPI0036BB136C
MSTPSTPPFANGGLLYPFDSFVVLAATVTVDGEPVTVQQWVDRQVWRRVDADPAMRAAYERRLHHDLAAALVDRLAPAVTVTERDPTPPGEAVSAALARADAAMRNQPEPEHRSPSVHREETH